jgi:hypothetical protein
MMVWQFSIQQEIAWQRHHELVRDSERRARLLGGLKVRRPRR